jgi:hypothetical protein
VPIGKDQTVTSGAQFCQSFGAAVGFIDIGEPQLSQLTADDFDHRSVVVDHKHWHKSIDCHRY